MDGFGAVAIAQGGILAQGHGAQRTCGRRQRRLGRGTRRHVHVGFCGANGRIVRAKAEVLRHRLEPDHPSKLRCGPLPGVDGREHRAHIRCELGDGGAARSLPRVRVVSIAKVLKVQWLRGVGAVVEPDRRSQARPGQPLGARAVVRQSVSHPSAVRRPEVARWQQIVPGANADEQHMPLRIAATWLNGRKGQGAQDALTLLGAGYNCNGHVFRFTDRPEVSIGPQEVIEHRSEVECKAVAQQHELNHTAPFEAPAERPECRMLQCGVAAIMPSSPSPILHAGSACAAARSLACNGGGQPCSQPSRGLTLVNGKPVACAEAAV
mmetsp:Transcript_15756/g.36081  ORF Transcript_15756/g.36081 Transcript_15756/m.36081 type:complete len:323 (-) Transcript_15756:189-1157(-)